MFPPRGPEGQFRDSPLGDLWADSQALAKARGLGRAFKPYKGNDHSYTPEHPELRTAQVRALPSPHCSPVHRAALSGPSVEVSFAGVAAECIGPEDGEVDGFRYVMGITAERKHGDTRARVLITLPVWDGCDAATRRGLLARAVELAIDVFEAAAGLDLCKPVPASDRDNGPAPTSVSTTSPRPRSDHQAPRGLP